MVYRCEELDRYRDLQGEGTSCMKNGELKGTPTLGEDDFRLVAVC